MNHSYLSGNHATAGDEIYSRFEFSTLKNTIEAKNTPGNCAFPSTIISSGHNLSDDMSCFSYFEQIGDVNSTPGGLDPDGLKNNGGPTQTIALLATSPAVDAIPASGCTDVSANPVTTDQRGVARPQGSACDIGAFELVPPVSFSASLTAAVDIKPKPSLSFNLNAGFILGAGSNGLNPLTELISLRVGNYLVSIPPGSFTLLLKNGKNGKAGNYFFSGVDGTGASFQVTIEPLGSGSFQLNATGSPVKPITNPVPVTISIGDDAGTVAVIANFKK